MIKLIFTVIILSICFSCKEVEDPTPFVNNIDFEILTDVPIESLTIKSLNDVIFPTQPINIKKSYTGTDGFKVYQYSEIINISENATIELIIPKNTKRKLFDVTLYDKVTIKYFFDEDGFTKKRFSIPEKN